jgi:hypothetical protein
MFDERKIFPPCLVCDWKELKRSKRCCTGEIKKNKKK